MTTKRLLASLFLGALAELTLLGVFVFIDEPPRVGRPAPAFHPWELAYLALPLLLMAAAAFLPARALLRGRRHNSASERS
jgi:hypothetical protein